MINPPKARRASKRAILVATSEPVVPEQDHSLNDYVRPVRGSSNRVPVPQDQQRPVALAHQP